MRHFTKKAVLSLALIGMASASAAANCAQRTHVTERLKTKYAEELTARGLQSVQGATAMVEVWSSSETGTFTVLISNANGISCIVAAGTDWAAKARQIAQVPKGIKS